MESGSGAPELPCDWLFSVSAEPVIIVEAATRRIVQANPAAAERLKIAGDLLIGRPLAETIDASSTATVSLFRTDTESYLLVRLASEVGDAGAAARSPVFDAVEGAPVGFLLTDAGFRVEYANQSFLDLVEARMAAEVQGKSLVRWLEFSGADRATLRKQMLKRQATSTMRVRLRTERHSSALEVEVCAVAVPDGRQSCWGFTVRVLPRLN